jgi:hypothetical protein
VRFAGKVEQFFKLCGAGGFDLTGLASKRATGGAAGFAMGFEVLPYFALI